MQKISVDVTFTHMTTNKGIKRHGDRTVDTMYKEYKKSENMKVMG